jgi:tRNA(fMet)-specific endonuclease VapC
VIYLLDTTTCVNYLRRRNSPIRERLNILGIGAAALCSPVKHELWFGALRSTDIQQNLQRLEIFFAGFQSLPVDDAASQRAAIIRNDLVQRNLLIGQFDILIAAIALEHNLIVVTNNSIHFSRVAGLQIEDWT